MDAQTTTHTARDSGVPAAARDFSLQNRVVIITGAAQGIGREFARQFAAAGAVPILADYNADGAHSVLGEIEAVGGHAKATKVDVADKSSVDEMATDILAE